jgi:two-component system, OmpR family, sensor kinase
LLRTRLRHLPVRMRLALWHAGAVALVLVTFALATVVYLSRSNAARVDAALQETARLVRRALIDEEAEGTVSTDSAALTIASAFGSSDRPLLIFDGSGRVLARSDSTQRSPTGTRRERAMPDLALIRTLARDAPATGSELRTTGHDDDERRVLVTRASYLRVPLVIVAYRLLSVEDEANEAFTGWLFASIPVALLLAGLGGYLLARRSLAPALAMGLQAEHISARSFDARLDIENANDELGQLGTTLNRLLERLQLSFVQQRQFMSDASHELRTPIAVVRAAADVALQSDAATVAELRDALGLVSTQGKRMTRIIEDLFLLARADSDEQPVHRHPLYLEELVIDAAKAGRALGRPRGVSVAADPPDESPFSGDASLLGRLLLNLVDNAVKHSPDGATVQLTLGTQERSGREPLTAVHWYRIAVTDAGSGVDPAIRADIFGRFVRGDRSRTRSEGGGAGLGLAIARWIATVHGGELLLEESSANGSCFVLWLPRST